MIQELNKILMITFAVSSSINLLLFLLAIHQMNKKDKKKRPILGSIGFLSGLISMASFLAWYLMRN